MFEDEGNNYTIGYEEKAMLKAGEAEYTGLIGRFFKLLLK